MLGDDGKICRSPPSPPYICGEPETMGFLSIFSQSIDNSQISDATGDYEVDYHGWIMFAPEEASCLFLTGGLAMG